MSFLSDFGPFTLRIFERPVHLLDAVLSPLDAARLIFRADFRNFCRFHGSCQTSYGAELLLLRPNATALVTQYALKGYLALETFDVIFRVILEQFGWPSPSRQVRRLR